MATEKQLLAKKQLLERGKDTDDQIYLPREFGEAFISSFHGLYKGAIYYDRSNVILHSLALECFKVIADINKSYTNLNIKIIRDAAFLQNIRIQVAADAFTVYKAFIQTFRRLHLGEVEIHRDITLDDLKEFVYVLHGLEPYNESNYLLVKKIFAQKNISTIDVCKLEPYQEEFNYLDSEKLKQQSKEVYFETINMVKELMAESANKKVLHVRKAKRLMLNTVNMIMHDESTLLGLTNIKCYDDYTFNHSVNVAIYAISMGQRLGIPKKQLNQLGMAGLFHDIGKTDIPKDLLNKPSTLDEDEWEIIKRHPLRGAEVIMNKRGWSELAARMISTAFEHHVKYDQSGYPTLSHPRQASLFSRIITIVDCYDAMGRPRVYRRFPFISEKIVHVMLERAGTDFDPLLIKVFINMIGIYPMGTLVLLDSGDLGLVTKVPNDPNLLDRPRVCLLSGSSGQLQRGEEIDLTDLDPERDTFKHSIVRTLDPNDYRLNVEEFFL